MFKVFITSRSFSSLSHNPLDLLIENHITPIFKDQSNLFTDKEMAKNIADFDAIIIGADEFGPISCASAQKLKIICKHGSGLDGIDLKSTKDAGIIVTNAPGANANAVADMTIGLIIDQARKLCQASTKVKAGKWEKVFGVDVWHKSLGLVGLGHIGRKVAQRANGFNMKIYAYDPYTSDEPDEYITLTSLETVLIEADFLSLHCPLSSSTRRIINAERLALMKKGSFLINTARGALIDENALYQSLMKGHIAGAGLDVTKNEPPWGSKLLSLEQVTIVPHIASYSFEALNEISMICAQNVVEALIGAKP